MNKPTRLTKSQLFPNKLPNLFLNRARDTIDFIDKFQFPACDCGEDNPLRKMINPVIESINVDFDRDKFPGEWNTIFCFEVLEHLYNPLFFLEELKKSLLPDGIIYLSTPYQWPHIIKGRHHFHEITTDRLMWLFDEAGLKIIKQGKVSIAGKWYNHFYGFRPILRYFQHSRIYKLK